MLYPPIPELPKWAKMDQLLHIWSAADMFNRDCYMEATTKFESNMARLPPIQYGPKEEQKRQEQEQEEQSLQTQFQEWGRQCDETYAIMVNKLPIRYCGIVVFQIRNIPGEPVLIANQNYNDDDGVSNYWEFKIGLDPCDPTTPSII